MSRLFEAISRLEAQSSSKSPQISLTGTKVKSASRNRPTLLLWLLIILMIVLIAAALTLYLLNNSLRSVNAPAQFDIVLSTKKNSESHKKTQEAKKITKDISLSHKISTSFLKPLDSSESSKRETVAMTLTPRKENQQNQTIKRSKANLNNKYNPSKLKEAFKKQLEKIEKIKAHSKDNINSSHKVQPLAISNKASNNSTILNFRQKRLLYTAESFRKQGRLDKALIIYLRIWKEKKNPLVANNLACILLEQGKAKEAYEILKKALIFKPDDEDLKYNLALAKEMMNNR